MRERVTFVQKLGDSLEPSALKVSDGTLSGPEVHAVREDRLTFALEELPAELRTLLNSVHELHIRWVSPSSYESISPLLARLPPGFHVFYTPRRKTDSSSEELCATLRKAFGQDISCSTPDDSFSLLPTDRFSHSTAFQYFQPLSTLTSFVSYAKSKLCRNGDDPVCASRLEALAQASTLDVSYDTISHALRATALGPYQRWPLRVTSRSGLRTEVGVLSADKPPTLEAHEIGISGLLTVLGDDQVNPKPSPTMFSFPSRHRDAESHFSAQFLSPTGLHPTLQLRLEAARPPADAEASGSNCTPHAYLTLPHTIFADKYQLSDSLFLRSKNLTTLRYSSSPVDLEAPDYVMSKWGSAILLELSPPSPEEKGAWTAQIPLHLRYLPPAAGGFGKIQVPYPAVFWACAAEEGTKFPNNPFEKVNVGYDGLFGPRTVFWHVSPRGAEGSLINEVRVPVLDLDKASWVTVGTAAVVLLGFGWVVFKLMGVVLAGGGKKVEGEKKKQ